jgi:Cu2+-containing amine oxidase
VNTPEQGPLEFNWDHQPQGFFIRRESTEVSLCFDSTAREWKLRIYKKKTSLGEPIAYEVVFKERYCPTAEQAITIANEILSVELRE